LFGTPLKKKEGGFILKEINMIKTYNGGSWVKDSRPSSFEDADIVFLPGGGDIGTHLYGHKPIKGAYFSKSTDDSQMALVEKTIKAGKFLFGTCRGAQLLTARAGGWLIQHIQHPGNHSVITDDGTEFNINSCHHQMCYMYDLPEKDYELYAWARQLSNTHVIQGDVQLQFDEKTLDENGLFKEPEIFYYPKIKAICAQNHFEWGSNSKMGYKFINDLIREKLNK